MRDKRTKRGKEKRAMEAEDRRGGNKIGIRAERTEGASTTMVYPRCI